MSLKTDNMFESVCATLVGTNDLIGADLLCAG